VLIPRIGAGCARPSTGLPTFGGHCAVAAIAKAGMCGLAGRFLGA